jgi:hypothetical protein
MMRVAAVLLVVVVAARVAVCVRDVLDDDWWLSPDDPRI